MAQAKQDMGSGSVKKLMLQLMIPAVVAQVVNLLYNIVDRIYIGHIPGIGAAALTGVGLFTPILMLLNAFAMLIGAGGAPRTAIAMGQGDKKQAEKIVSNSFTMLLIFSVLLTVVFYAAAPALLRMFGASDATLPYALAYSRIYILGSVCVLLVMGMNPFITTQGFAKISMLTTVIGAVINIILDPILIFGLGPVPALGIAGAALATGIGQTVTLVLYLVVYCTTASPVRLRRKALRPDASLEGRLYAIGVPAILNLALPSLLVTFLNGLLAVYSQSYVTVLGIYYKLQTFLYLPANGIVQGMRPLISYNYGAGEHKRVRRLYQITLILSAAIMAAGTLGCLAASEPLMRLFTSTPETVEAGKIALRIICLGFVVSAISTTSSGALEGLGKGTQSLVISLCRYIVFIMPLAWVLCRQFGPVGVWNAFWATEVLSAIVSLIVYKKSV